MTDDTTSITSAIVKQLEAAWNAGDGKAFAADFLDDADFVDVRGDHHSGRMPIEFGHQALFDSIYKGSTNEYTLVTARRPAPGVIWALVHAKMEAPIGPMKGVNNAHFSLMLVQVGDAWKVATFHNTLVAPEGTPGRS